LFCLIPNKTSVNCFNRGLKELVRSTENGGVYPMSNKQTLLRPERSQLQTATVSVL